MTVLAKKGSNILLPWPGFPVYETACGHNGIDIRFYDLIPENNWEVDLDQVEALADDKTVAMVISNPSNPCGAVFSNEHLSQVCYNLLKKISSNYFFFVHKFYISLDWIFLHEKQQKL